MKLLSPVIKTIERDTDGEKYPAKALAKLEENFDKSEYRIGRYFSKLNTYQKQKFRRIENAMSSKFKIFPRKTPLEMILVRQIALNTVRIEQAELDILEGNEIVYAADVEKWLFLAQKERREAITTLNMLLKRENKKDELGKFGELRDTLRKEENLPKTDIVLNPHGHDRRHYDDITRTAT